MTDTILEAVLDSYIECALWTTTDESDERGGNPLDDNYGPSDLSPEALEAMRKDCARFLRDNKVILETFDELYPNWFTKYSTEEMIGHDFWLTRNGHGAGFWDGGWPGITGDILTRSCKAFGECNLYVGDDSKIYVC
jgi:hypothetical protein